MQEHRKIESGRLTMAVGNAQGRALRFDGLEVLRGLSAPVRDADWGTFEQEIEGEEFGSDRYLCRFRGAEGLFTGVLEITLAAEHSCTAEVTLIFAKAARLNRAGFCLLHPIRGVAGTPLTVLHPDGSQTDTAFPARIAPGQPAGTIAGLSHRIGEVRVDISTEGEVFEMEDQRNWSDASFKTYCRPLAWTRPFAVEAGEVVQQKVVIRLDGPRSFRAGTRPIASVSTVMPQVLLAHQSGLSSLDGLTGFPGLPVLARINPDTDDAALAALSARPMVALELVVEAAEEIAALSARVRAAGLRPVRVTALPRTYLQSHQPEGPWPGGATPADCLQALRAAFPGVPAGGGSLTHFTEFNRCRPVPEADFLTFGNAAIVHAADDLSVCQTLEALQDILASAKAIGPGRPLHLGLISIGMRSNPYGCDVLPNPEGRRLAMACRDPRQDTAFAAAYALAVLVIAAEAGVASLALAMPDGPLGAARRPIARVVQLGDRLAGQRAEVSAAEGVFRLRCGGMEAVANLSDAPVSASGTVLAPASLHIMGEAT